MSRHRAGAVSGAAAAGRAQGARAFWEPWIALALALLVGVSCLLGGSFVASVIAARWTSAAAIEALFTVAIFGPMIPIVLLVDRWTRVSPLRAGRRPLRFGGAGLLIGAGGLAAAVGLTATAGAVRVGGAGLIGPGLLVAASGLVLLQSASEEVFVRGWLLPVLARRWRAWTAVIVSALLFTTLHVVGGARAPLTLVNLTLGGVLFALLARASGGLAAPIAAHVAWNWSEALLLGLMPNPGVGGFGALVDLDLVGPALQGGSDEGLNASAGMTLALLAMIALVQAALARRMAR